MSVSLEPYKCNSGKWKARLMYTEVNFSLLIVLFSDKD